MVQYKFSSIYITGLCFIYKGTTVLVQWCISSKFSTALYYSCISNLAAAGGLSGTRHAKSAQI